jgi:Putative transposase, YhgA-like
LVPVLPIVLYHGAAGWGASNHFHELFEPGLLDQLGIGDFIPSFRFILDDLSEASDGELHRRAEHAANKVVPVVLWALRDARKTDQFYASLMSWLGAISVARNSPTGKAAISAVFKYISLVAENLTPNDILAAVERAAPETKDSVMTLAEIWTQQGIEKGRIEGIERGERAILVKLIVLKFGKIDAASGAKLDAATPAQLELWAERILTATSIDEVIG